MNHRWALEAHLKKNFSLFQFNRTISLWNKDFQCIGEFQLPGWVVVGFIVHLAFVFLFYYLHYIYCPKIEDMPELRRGPRLRGGTIQVSK